MKTPHPGLRAELVEKAEFELEVFERCSQVTCRELIAEVKRLREVVEKAADACCKQ